jgi:hypothetical protein
MKKINEILSTLVGLSLTMIVRESNIVSFRFGEYISTDEFEKSTSIEQFGLFLFCPWRITNETGIIIGMGDINAEEEKGYFFETSQIMDIYLKKLEQNKQLLVVSAKTDKIGGFEIFFDNNSKLTTFPDYTYKDSVYWRFIDFRKLKTKSITSMTSGYLIK